LGPAKTADLTEMPFGMWTRVWVGQMNRVRWAPDTAYERVILRGNVILTANGWLNEYHQQFFYNEIPALEKRRPKCISVAGNFVEE